MQSHLTNQWIVITGASSGIGAATANAFAAFGCRVCLGARRVDRLNAVAEDCRKNGAAEVVVHALDVTQTGSVEAFQGAILQHAPQVPVLVNNAGGALGLDPVATGRDDDWETMLQTNVLGVMRMTRALLPLMQNVTGATQRP